VTAAFANENTTTASGVTSVVLNKPASTASGDLLVVSLNGSSGETAFTAPSGWTTMIASWTDNNDSAGATFWKLAGGSEPASYTFTWTTSGDIVASIKRYTASNQTTPIRTSRIDHKGATGASFTSTALAGVQATDLTVVVGQMGDDSGSTTFTVTMPGSPWTTIDNIIADRPKWQGASYAAGSQSGATFTSTSATAYWNITSYAIAAGGTAWAGAAALSGSGTLTANWAFEGSAALSGSGTLVAAGADTHRSSQLTGSGSLTANRRVTYVLSQGLDGSGTLTATGFLAGAGSAAMSGSGSLSAFPTLGYRAQLAGTGTLNILQPSGGLVFASPGAATPYGYPHSSQVAVAPQGSSNWQYLGQLGEVTALKYSFICPGGDDKMSCTVMVPASYRTELFDPGWQVRITRGGHIVWTGKLDEPVSSPAGWNLTAVGTGNRGDDFLAIYTSTWPSGQPDQSINNAISRGLPWNNPGVGTPSTAWFGQAVDSGAQTIKGLLDLICTRGQLTWYVSSQPGGALGPDLSVFPLPTVPNRVIVATTPVARTLHGDINTIYLRYMISDATATGTTATYGLTSVQNAQSVAAHGELETFIDISDAGIMSAGTAQQMGNYVLSIYQRASFAGPFTVHHGELLNTGGQPIDPGTDQAGTMCRLILTDYGYGGEVTPGQPITFIVGAYEWDDTSQVATVTPYQSVDQSLTGILNIEHSLLKPVTVASGP
jgi:hypothetical protein